MTGEASPEYIFHPLAAERLAREYPSMKLILIHRNPIDRAYSHFQMNVRDGLIETDWRRCAAMELERWGSVPADASRLPEDAGESYLLRSLILQDLQRWLTFFPSRQILLIRSEEYFRDQAGVLERIQRFLGLPLVRLDRFPNINKGSYKPMDPGIRADLERFFQPHREAEQKFLAAHAGKTG
jgi:hypothetical protein